MTPAEVRPVDLDDVAVALPVQEALVLTLTDEVGAPADFIAAMLGITEAETIRIVARARKRLAERMGETNGRA